MPAPTVNDLSVALQTLQVRHVIQPHKGYSRDAECLWDNPGRVLVDVSTRKKKDLMLELAKLIPNLPQRIERLERQALEDKKAEEERKAAAEKERKEAAALAKRGTASNTGNKKKGKKGKRK